MWTYTYETELTHHGIKGMKWGVRKDKNKSGGSRKKVSLRSHEDYRRAHKRKSIKRMSDKELNDRNKRLQAEETYKKLRKKSDKGRLAVKITLATAGTVAATAGAVTLGKKYLPGVLEKVALSAPKIAGLLT